MSILRLTGFQDRLNAELAGLMEAHKATKLMFCFHDRFGTFMSKHTVHSEEHFEHVSEWPVKFMVSIPIHVRPDPCVHDDTLYVPIIDNDQTFAWLSLSLGERTRVDLQGVASWQQKFVQLIADYDTTALNYLKCRLSNDGLSSPGNLISLLVNRKLRIKAAQNFRNSAFEGVGNFEVGSYLHLDDLEAEKSLRTKLQLQFQRLMFDPRVTDAVTATSVHTSYPTLLTISGTLLQEPLIMRLLRDCTLHIRLIDPLGDVSDLSAKLADTLKLTKKQAQIACRLALGESPADVARAENCSIETVRWHIKQLGNKLGISKQPRLVAYIGRVAYSLVHGT